jgi:energy-coupling factor transporter ATP-binding protein EcfA2
LVIGRDIDFKSTCKPISIYERLLDNLTLEQINGIIENYYTYIYIPVEQQASTTLKIENIQMQKIMNQNIILKIESLLKEKLNVDGKNQSLIDHINGQLSVFIDEINSIVKNVDETYEFKAARNKKQNLTASDIVDNILEGYFSKRTLKDDQKEVNQLSSGEQRRAMIDIIYAFLKNRGREDEANGRNVILAIDEPEVSQDISHCFEQFERLEKLSNEYGNQVLVTTHWYGILPVIETGTMLHLSKTENYENKATVFDFYNYLDNQEKFPDEIQLKSMYDLAISLSTYIRKEDSKYLLICEGGTDKRYLETLLDSEKVRVLPVGGINNVKNIYNLLVMPLKIDKKANSVKRVLCLTDTDPSLSDDRELGKDPSGNIQLKRLQINLEASKVDLVSFDNFNPNAEYTVTRIEDVLSPEIYKVILENLLKEDYEGINLSGYSFYDDSIFTNMRGDTQFLFCSGIDAVKRKADFIKFIESQKTRLSYEYVKEFDRKYKEGKVINTPPVFLSIQEFFKDSVLKCDGV